MIETIRAKLVPAFKVKVIQQIAGRDYTWTSEIVATVVNFSQQTTGKLVRPQQRRQTMARPADAAKSRTVKSTTAQSRRLQRR